jgi:serine/threonine protein kinase
VSIRKCPTPEELSSYVQGGLPEDLTEAVAEHIETCVICDATVEELGRQGNSLFRGSRRPAPPPPELESPEYRRAMEAAEAAGPDGGDPVTAPVAEPSLSELGRLGEYELLAKLGVGGMGTVYKARQTRLGKIVALKVLASERTSDPRAVARFENEMKAVGQLSHPNIVQALDARDIEGTTVLVMEYVDGVDLSKLVQRTGPLPIADACELIRQTAVGLQYIHENGLVHRDVKPSNLILTPQGQVKILDLGLALLGSDQTPGKELTSSGLAMGTPDYIAPEQADDSHRVDIRADIYSLGCTLYHLLTGRAPFSGPNYKTPLNKVVGHARDKVPTVKTLRASVPDELSRIVERMMAKEPAARFTTPVEVAAALTPFATGCDLAGLLATPLLPHGTPADGAPARLPSASSPPWWRGRPTRIVAAAAIPLSLLLGIVIYIEIKAKFEYTPEPKQTARSEPGAIAGAKKPLEAKEGSPEPGQPRVPEVPASKVPSATATSGSREDFEGSTLDTSRWVVGGRRMSWTPADSGHWRWSHTLTRDPGDPDGYLCMDAKGPATENSYGAILWIRSSYNLNDNRAHLITFTWKIDVIEGHGNRYFVQITDGDNLPTFKQEHSGDDYAFKPTNSFLRRTIPGTVNLLWQNTKTERRPGRDYATSSSKQKWSLTIDASGLARLYDSPGSLLDEQWLDRSRAWYLRFLIYDGTSKGWGAGHSRLDLYSLDVTNWQPVRFRPDQAGSGTQKKPEPSGVH